MAVLVGLKRLQGVISAAVDEVARANDTAEQLGRLQPFCWQVAPGLRPIVRHAGGVDKDAAASRRRPTPHLNSFPTMHQ